MMNKELKALEKLTKIHSYDEFNECYKIIENGLKALEIIKEIVKLYPFTCRSLINLVSEERDILKDVLL